MRWFFQSALSMRQSLRVNVRIVRAGFGCGVVVHKGGRERVGGGLNIYRVGCAV